MNRIAAFIGMLTLLLLSTSSAVAQQSDSTAVRTDTVSVRSDSTIARPVAPPRTNAADIKDAVRFQSSDSLIFRFTGQRRGTLFGSAQVKHSAGELNAGKIALNLDNSTVEAKSATPEDTLSFPVLKRQQDEIKSTRILFNYTTQKGKFETAYVTVQDGNLIGTQVKNVSQYDVFIKDGIYSTCPADHMYYYIKARKMKVVDQDEIFFSDARLYILDIPYPLIFPFGYVPADIQKTKSGLLTPTYVFQNQSSRGIGFQNLGWFQYFNDYITGQGSLDIFTSGTFAFTGVTNYKKGEQFSGRVQIGYSVDRGLESTDANFTKSTSRQLIVTHNQKFSPYANLTADVNLRTADFFTRNSFNIDDRATTTSNSKLSYNYRHPDGKYTFGTSTQLAQNFNNNTTTLRGPSTTFSIRAVSPFQKPRGSGNTDVKPKFYENLTLNYRNNFSSDFNFDPIDDDSTNVTFFEALFSPSTFREATGSDNHYRFGFQQVASAALTNLLPSQFLNTTLNFNITETLFPTRTRRTFNAAENTVETERERGLFTAREYSTNFTLNTTFYGISNRKIGALQGFRHTVRPTVSFTYRPDFSKDRFGYFETVQVDTATGRTQRFSVFDQEIFRGPGAGEQLALNFGVANQFETKLVKRDSTGEVTERNLKLIDNFSLQSSYNFAADSLNLANLTTNLTSTVVRGINFRAGANLSFYQRDENGLRFNRFLWEDGGKLAQLESLNISAGTSFRGGRNGVQVVTPRYQKVYDPFNQSIFNPIDPHFGDQPIVNRNAPWSVGLNFDYRWTFQFNQSPRISAALNATNISFMLTPLWSFNTRMGYDFIQKELTPSQFNLTRQLECWSLSFQINPFGEFQYYFFSLKVNSSQIQSLFQKLPLLNNLERNSSPTGRRL